MCIVQEKKDLWARCKIMTYAKIPKTVSQTLDVAKIQKHNPRVYYVMPKTTLASGNNMYLQLKHQSAPCQIGTSELQMLFSNVQHRNHTESPMVAHSLFETETFALMNGSP